MPRTLVGATEEVVSKPSTFGRDLDPDNHDAIATFR